MHDYTLHSKRENKTWIEDMKDTKKNVQLIRFADDGQFSDVNDTH